MFFAQWVSHPYVQKALIYKGFSQTQSFVLVINTTVSTWLELMELMSVEPFQEPSVRGNMSICFSMIFEKA